MEPDEKVFDSLIEAADHCHVTKQAIYVAIKKGHLKANLIKTKDRHGIVRKRWSTTLDEIEEYQRNKYSREKTIYEGERVFDIESGKFTVEQVAKLLTQIVGYVYPKARVYYLLRTGQLRSFRKGRFWVIDANVLKEFSEAEKLKKPRRRDTDQLRFA